MRRAFVHLLAVVYLVLGVACTVRTVPMLAALDIVLPTGQALTDARATYGGMELGIAVGLWLTLARDEWLAVRVGTAGLFGLGLTRLVGIAFDDGGTPLMLAFVAIELGLGVVGLWLGRD